MLNRIAEARKQKICALLDKNNKKAVENAIVAKSL
jgi:hypothetical protein